MGGEGSEGTDFAGAREASAEEREFHAQMTNGNRGEGREQPGSGASERSEAPREPQREQQREPQRESRGDVSQGSQAPLDLPPPPPTKPFVVWSSSPSDAVPGPRRDE